MQDKDMSVVEHLRELRTRILLVIVPAIVLTVYFYYICPWIVKFLLAPVSGFKLGLMFTGITDAFVTRLKLSFFSAVFVLSPWIMYQAIMFVGPGLTKKERQVLFKGLVSLSITFILGIAFGYFLLLPHLLTFLLTYGKSYMIPALLGDKYISFIAVFCLIMGMTFALPVVFIFLGKLGLLSSGFLRKIRKYVIISIIAIEGLIIPTDDLFVFLYIGLPIMAFYELSIWVIHFMEKKKKRLMSNERISL